jgi:hypothetical protein
MSRLPLSIASNCASFLLCLALLSCTEEKEIPTFRIANTKAETPQAAPKRTEPRPLRWIAPETWVKLEDAARFASYRIPASSPDGIDGDVSVIPLPGDGGTTLEKVNLWRAQLRLPPLERDDDPALGETTRSPAGTITLTHMVSAVPLFSKDRHGAISAAILRTGEVTWFFKIAGEAGMVAANRAKFVEFVRTAEAR